MREKMVSLTLRGFDCPAQEVASLFLVQSSKAGNCGEPVRPYVKTLLVRSYVQYSLRFASEHPLCEMLPDFLAYLGGIEHLCMVRKHVQPEFFEFHFELPVKQSMEPQDGYLATKDIEDIARLGASISLGFY